MGTDRDQVLVLGGTLESQSEGKTEGGDREEKKKDTPPAPGQAVGIKVAKL